MCSYKVLDSTADLSNCELSEVGLKKMENGDIIKITLTSGKQCCKNCPIYKELDIHHKAESVYKKKSASQKN